jgi:hypothetical protein
MSATTAAKWPGSCREGRAERLDMVLLDRCGEVRWSLEVPVIVGQTARPDPARGVQGLDFVP